MSWSKRDIIEVVLWIFICTGVVLYGWPAHGSQQIISKCTIKVDNGFKVIWLQMLPEQSILHQYEYLTQQCKKPSNKCVVIGCEQVEKFPDKKDSM